MSNLGHFKNPMPTYETIVVGEEFIVNTATGEMINPATLIQGLPDTGLNLARIAHPVDRAQARAYARRQGFQIVAG